MTSLKRTCCTAAQTPQRQLAFNGIVTVFVLKYLIPPSRFNSWRHLKRRVCQLPCTRIGSFQETPNFAIPWKDPILLNVKLVLLVLRQLPEDCELEGDYIGSQQQKSLNGHRRNINMTQRTPKDPSSRGPQSPEKCPCTWSKALILTTWTSALFKAVPLGFV